MSEKTIHSNNTTHGYRTPHKYPFDDDSDVSTLNNLSTQLYPTGRAWYMSEKSNFAKLHEGVNISFARLIKDSQSLIDSNIPDNENFSKEDASLWEFRLGLISNDSVDIGFRREGIKRKLGHPNNIRARQHKNFIQAQLQLSGFNVFVHENLRPFRSPSEITNLGVNEVQHGGDTQHGAGAQHGGDTFEIIANSIDEIESYAVGENGLWATFFIGGEVLGSIATVPKNRLKEFKELVIKMKPAHLVAFTFINYT